LLPNLYVYIFLYSIKEDLVNEKIQRDIHIILHEQDIEINNKHYTIKGTLDSYLVGFILVSLFSFVIDYSSLAILLLYAITFVIIGVLYEEELLIIVNPYLRLKYQVFILQGGEKILYIIMEKEKEFEKPRFSEYIIDWYYDHLILIGFKNKTS